MNTPTKIEKGATAWEILGAIAAWARVEPLAIHMDQWWDTKEEWESRKQDREALVGRGRVEDDEQLTPPEKQHMWPLCGSIGCVAGHVVAMTRQRLHGVGYFGMGYFGMARQTLGLTSAQASALFQPPLWANMGEDILNPLYDQPGTPEHAERVAQHVEGFMQQHEGQLKNWRWEG